MKTELKLQLSDGVSVINTLHYTLGPCKSAQFAHEFMCRAASQNYQQVLVVAKFFGVLPVAGVWPTADVRQVHFRWCSLAVLLTFVQIGFASIDFYLSVKVIAEHGLMLYTTGPLNFSVVCLISIILFLLLSRDWPHLIKQTRRCEAVFLQPCYASPASKHFTCRIRTIGVALLCGAVAEHLLYRGSGAYNNHLQIKQCNLTVDFWENYFRRERKQVFTVISYHVWLIPLLEWMSISMTFAWNFVDILLVMLCHSLAMRFRQMHWRIACHAQQHMHSNFWLEVRQDFLSLTELLCVYDEKVSGLILLSCAHNLYFICVQIFNSFQGKGNFMNEIYFWGSLLFVLTRILAMMFSAAAVHEAASAVSATVYQIPSAFWCLELKRLNETLVSDVIALSGKGFFLLTRRLIFAMAGTIVIYELVLIDQIDEVQEQGDYCSV